MTAEDARSLLLQLATGASSRTELWLEFIRRTQPRACAEVGVWKGAFAAKVLQRCPSVTSYLMLDPWRQLDFWNKPKNADQDELDAARDAAIRATEFAAERRKVLQGTTLEVIDCIPDRSLDFIYVDGDHTLRGITIDLVALWPKLRHGGVLAGDDLCPSAWQHGPDFEPTGVFPFAVYFAEAIRRPMVALPFEQFAIVDTPGHRFDDATGRYGDTSLLGAIRLPLYKKWNRWARQRVRSWRRKSGAT